MLNSQMHYLQGHKKTNRALVLLAVPLLMIVTFFPIIKNGPDYAAYLDYYQSSRQCVSCIMADQGYGFSLLMGLFSQFGIDFEVFFYFIASISLSIKLYVASKVIKKNAIIAILLYLTSFLFLHELIQIRVATSLSLFILSAYIFFIRDKKIIASFLYISAVLVHPSSAIFIVGYLLFKLTNKVHPLIIFASMVVFFYIYNLEIERFSDFLFYAIDVLGELSFGNINNYLYEMTSLESANVNYFSIQTLDSIVTLVVYFILRCKRDCNTKNPLLEFFAQMIILALVLKYLTLNAPVVSFRLFEMLSIGSFIVKAYIVVIVAKYSLPGSFFIFFVFAFANIYTYIISSPLFLLKEAFL